MPLVSTPFIFFMSNCSTQSGLKTQKKWLSDLRNTNNSIQKYVTSGTRLVNVKHTKCSRKVKTESDVWSEDRLINTGIKSILDWRFALKGRCHAIDLGFDKLLLLVLSMTYIWDVYLAVAIDILSFLLGILLLFMI